MKIFVAGATGAVGRPLVRRLLEEGHEVAGLSRSEERAARLREDGAKAIVADVLDRTAVEQAVTSFAPDVVVDQLTDLPRDLNVLRVRRFYERHIEVRRDGGRNLFDAAVAAGARRYVVQSVAFLYDPSGDSCKSEDDGVFRDPPPPWDIVLPITVEMEQRVVGSGELEGLVLRYGFFYGPGTHYALEDGALTGLVRRRRMPIVGAGAGLFSFIHVEDAAEAAVCAVTRGAPGIYNIVDDVPLAQREWLPLLAGAVGASMPRRVPVWLARLVTGPLAAMQATRLRAATNAKARRELGWEPRYRSFAEGLKADALPA